MARSKTVVLNGCFDILHVGHFNALTYARRLATRQGCVYVLLDSDAKVKKDKGESRPYFTWIERYNNLINLNYSDKMGIIDDIFSFDTNEGLYESIRDINPDIIIKGSEWKDNVIGSDIAKVIHFDTLQEYTGKIVKYSTTEIVDRILEKNKKNI